MRALLLKIAFAWLFVFSLASPALAGGSREIRVSIRPHSVPPDVTRWAYYPGTGLTLLGDQQQFDKATNDLIVFIFDKDADPRGNCTLKEVLDRRNEQPRLDPHQPQGGLAKCGGSGPEQGDRPRTWDAEGARTLAQVGALASGSSPAGEKGGNPHGIAGGMNPDASSSPGKQAIAAGVQIFLAAPDIEQIVRVATRFIVAKFTTKAERAAIEAAARQAVDKGRNLRGAQCRSASRRYPTWKELYPCRQGGRQSAECCRE